VERHRRRRAKRVVVMEPLTEADERANEPPLARRVRRERRRDAPALMKQGRRRLRVTTGGEGGVVRSLVGRARLRHDPRKQAFSTKVKPGGRRARRRLTSRFAARVTEVYVRRVTNKRGKRRGLFVTGLALLSFPLSSASGCGGSESEPATGDAALDAPPRMPPERPAASCPVVIEAPAYLSSPHVPEGTAIQYNSNPPSSGPHYPVWANFQEHAKPIERPYLVHSLEHGAIALLYKCDGAACGPILEQLRKVRDSLPRDPLCQPDTPVRVVIAPDPLIAKPIAAAAWGFTYNADCVDVPTLEAFARDHYAKGPENICAAGRTF
jgi:uncharacterized protein DUF3105